MPNRMISYGYGIAEGRITVVEREAEIIRRVFREYQNGRKLQEIAERLAKEGVEFYLGDTRWNKGKVFRIIENEKYIGKDEYPAIIEEKEFRRANEEKSRRGNKKITLAKEIVYLRKITYCGQCGKPFCRRTKWGKRERWYCPDGCKTDYVDDGMMFREILSAIEAIVGNPNFLSVQEKSVTYHPTPEIMRYANEVSRIINQLQPSFSEGKKVILECAGLKFQACHEEPAVYTKFISEKAQKVWENKNVGIDFLSEAVVRIDVYKDGKAAVKFRNGAKIIGREVKSNAAEDSYKDRSESTVD